MGRRFFVLFLYDCLRLAVFADAAARVAFAPEVAAGFVPLVVLAAPSPLFPLMAFFLWRDAARYAAYRTLYAAGKGSLCALGAAGILLPFFAGRLTAGGIAFSLDGAGLGPALPACAACVLFDLASALCAASAPRAADGI